MTPRRKALFLFLLVSLGTSSLFGLSVDSQSPAGLTEESVTAEAEEVDVPRPAPRVQESPPEPSSPQTPLDVPVGSG